MSQASPDPSGQRRVLVVEDQRDTRETLKLLLSMHGHQVEVAGDGVEGLEKAMAFLPDVGLFDIGLPRCDGYELARGVRANLGDGPFLIALTAYTSAEDRRKSLEAGFNIHLAKPADPGELCQLIKDGR